MGDKKIVLLSGGWESAACLVRAHNEKEKVCCLFFDYGQPYLRQELLAATRVAKFFGYGLIREKIKLIKPQRLGVFEHRNEQFLVRAKHLGATTIYFGCRAPLPVFDRYGDSNWWYAKKMAKALDVKIKTPCVMWPKWFVKDYVSNLIPPHLIYSSEEYVYEQ